MNRKRRIGMPPSTTAPSPKKRTLSKRTRRTIGAVLASIIIVFAAYVAYIFFIEGGVGNNSNEESAVEYDKRQEALREEYVNTVDKLSVEKGQDDSGILWTQMSVFFESGEYDRAVDSGLQLTTRDDFKDNIRLYEYLANSYAELGNRDKEKEMIQRILSIAEDTPDTISASEIDEYRGRL